MSRLIAGNYYSFGVRQIPDSGILQGIELKLLAEAKLLAHLRPSFVKDIAPLSFAPGHHRAPEKVVTTWSFENLQLYHQHYHLLVKGHVFRSAVLGIFSGDEDTLLFYADVANSYVNQLAGANHRVIFHHDRKQEISVCPPEVGRYQLQFLFRQRPADLFSLLEFLRILGDIHGYVFLPDEISAKNYEKISVIVVGSRRDISLQQQVIEEADNMLGF